MSKKHKKQKFDNKQQAAVPHQPQQKKVVLTGISKLGKKIIFTGITVLAIGFLILTKTDPEGQNWASFVSPFLIIGAYIMIAVGIIIPDGID
jgi:hypothetical protein